jgi:hypothetical protein
LLANLNIVETEGSGRYTERDEGRRRLLEGGAANGFDHNHLGEDRMHSRE